MITTRTSSISWAADASGMSLTLRTPEARRIAEAVKPDKEYTVEIKEFKKKRSLDQNALYWKWLTVFAEAIGITNEEAHNRLLYHYGQYEIYDDHLVYVVLPDSDDAEQRALRSTTYHIKPTSQTKVGNDGVTYRTYVLLRGSSTYDTSEMKRLLDGLIEECRCIGIDVITPREQALLEATDG